MPHSMNLVELVDKGNFILYIAICEGGGPSSLNGKKEHDFFQENFNVEDFSGFNLSNVLQTGISLPLCCSSHN